MMNMVRYSDSSYAVSMAYSNGSIKRPHECYRYGIEIEQAAKKDQYNENCYPITINMNPANLPLNIPEPVIARSVIFADGAYDGSRPWEFNCGNSIRGSVLVKKFYKVVGNDIWCWHKEFRNMGGVRGCSAHVHSSVIGPIKMGIEFDNQLVGPACDWTMIWNNLVSLTPLVIPFFCFGQTFRGSALSEWAQPVYDRFNDDNIISLFENGQTVGNFTGRIYRLGHDYYCLSWNRHRQKKQITIENRLNENPPQWVVPALQTIALFNNGCLKRGKSIKIKDWKIRLPQFWSRISTRNVYDALKSMEEIEFAMPKDKNNVKDYRGIPYLCGGWGHKEQMYGDDRKYPTALDLFRYICRRFSRQNHDSPIGFEKVMRLWSDFINLESLPSDLVWDIDKLYDLIYLSPEKKHFQDQYLYYGSSVVDLSCNVSKVIG